MAETAPAPAASTAKTPKKKSASKAKKSGPSVSDLILKAVSASSERKGVSLAALKKALAGGGYDVEKNNSRVKLALKALVKKGALVQTKGTGASGSFKVSKGAVTPKKPVKKPEVKARKPAAKKTPEKKVKPKKSPAKKPAAKKAPKKVKKPAAAAAKKATKSPKKAKKPAPKKVTKSPSKKVKPGKPKAAKPKAKAKKAAGKKK
ncbi:histone H1 [Silurus meridionalis]|uniref:Histone H1 n=1 Tax=Silurus meridionalis TaxID=175797 RepID=A0A8T0AB10_SILME|nr:histone H1 [Silurus meridionalis]KAF7687650.1 hypothetical protein HF521_014878 [Silurus meridionalis]KAI5091311.1 histone H1-like [Silurus meridionalis]